MKTFYLSLCRGLTGYYVRVEAPSEDAVRRHAIKYFGQMWCSIYTDGYFHEVLRKRYPTSSKVINNRKPIVLTNEEGDWE